MIICDNASNLLYTLFSFSFLISLFVLSISLVIITNDNCAQHTAAAVAAAAAALLLALVVEPDCAGDASSVLPQLTSKET